MVLGAGSLLAWNVGKAHIGQQPTDHGQPPTDYRFSRPLAVLAQAAETAKGRVCFPGNSSAYSLQPLKH